VSGDEGPWSATISVRCENPQLVGWVERSLRPEAAREVPRASAELETASPDTVVITISAHDSGALRAALNTYLGWVELSLATARAAVSKGRSGDPRA
jgi:tRNA threonylcarbamoyladenosine modification (KEOPS) complex  Pcc1 subunit